MNPLETIKCMFAFYANRMPEDDKRLIKEMETEIGRLPDINLQDALYHRTALHYAATYNFPSMVDLLLKRGASDTIIDAFSLTPFVVSWANGHVECACLLAIANPRIVDFTDPFWVSPRPPRCNDPRKKKLLTTLLDLMRRDINVWDWVLEQRENLRAAHAALGLDHDLGKGALLQRYAYADPVREAILQCLVPTKQDRALVLDLHALLEPFCSPPLEECVEPSAKRPR